MNAGRGHAAVALVRAAVHCWRHRATAAVLVSGADASRNVWNVVPAREGAHLGRVPT